MAVPSGVRDRAGGGSALRFAALAAVNLTLQYVVVHRDPEGLRRHFAGYDGGPSILDPTIFPVVTTTLLTTAIALVIAALGVRFDGARLAGAYVATALWCTGGAMLLQQRPSGDPNGKMAVLALGILVIWMAVAATAGRPSWTERMVTAAVAVAAVITIVPTGPAAVPTAAVLLGGASGFLGADLGRHSSRRPPVGSSRVSTSNRTV